jgi:hypothetical protein
LCPASYGRCRGSSWYLKAPGFRGGGLETEFGMEASKIIEGIVETTTPSPTLAEVPVVVSETRVAAEEGKLDGGTSGENVARRGMLRRLFDDQSTFIDLVSKPHWALVTGSPTFSGSSPDGSHSVFLHDLYLKLSTADSGAPPPTIFEGKPLEFFYLDLDSSENVEGLSGNIDGFTPEAMLKNTLVEVYGLDSSKPVAVVSDSIDGLAPEAMGGGSVVMKRNYTIFIQVRRRLWSKLVRLRGLQVMKPNGSKFTQARWIIWSNLFWLHP